jgi:putative membrane protein
MSPPLPEGDPRIYLAAERTLLAWIRTGLALMGFGFVVTRFGLLVRELSFSPTASPTPNSDTLAFSLWFGTGLILLGVIVQLISVWQYQREINRLRSGEPYRPQVNWVAVALGLLLASSGVCVAVYQFIVAFE